MSKASADHIRNFCIIAHIDHGKSTLADRLLQMTGTIADRDMQNQALDDMDLERERGITIKSKAIQMDYELGGQKYVLNLIDTPGHVDFSYEVSRSIAACEGALLIVDATQGIQAQTISNLYLALEHDLEIIPILNKMDLPSANPEEVKDQIVDLLGCKHEDILPASGKTGLGVDKVLEEIVHRIPAPKGDPSAPLQALIFDSVFNSFRGIIAYFRVMNGTIKKGEQVKFFNTGVTYGADEVGILKMDLRPKPEVKAGDVGYIISGIKTASEVKVGDTITHVERPCAEAIKGFEDVKPMVWAGIFPVDTDEYEELRDAMEKLKLNDASLTWTPETSAALGFGFRCGFLGLLHMEIIQERLTREYDLDLITTAPSVVFKLYMKDGEVRDLHNPADMPDLTYIDHIEEPRIKATIMVPDDYLGDVLKLCQDRRGIQMDLTYAGNRAMAVYDLPLAEVVFDFYDRLKSVTKGYASFDYTIFGYREDFLVKMSILVNDEPVDALSIMVHRDRAEARGRVMVEKLKELIPRHMFKIPIQAAIGGRVIARETLSAMRKDVTAKCYGGDATRKRKLLDKQKAGKKKMRQFGKVEIPQEAFINALKMDG